MKTLANHLILYDAECPMCGVYTKAFVTSGFLDKDGREPYQKMDERLCPNLDRNRAANEIALVDRSTGEVTYGVNSFIKIFATVAPELTPLLTFKPFIWLAKKVYSFISYNRKVIISAKKVKSTTLLQPTFRLDYRIAYLIFTWAITALILSFYAKLMTNLVPAGGLYREAMICGGQIFFQGFIILFIAKDKFWDYLGNMMTISFAGSLLLLPSLFIVKYFNLNVVLAAIYFICIAGLMFLEHIRRTKILEIGWTMTVTWALYRLIILFTILFME